MRVLSSADVLPIAAVVALDEYAASLGVPTSPALEVVKPNQVFLVAITMPNGRVLGMGRGTTESEAARDAYRDFTKGASGAAVPAQAAGGR